MTKARTFWNGSRFKPEDSNGFYESYFQRANHPTRPLAFWIRYTCFLPRRIPDKACGELWAIYFDCEANRIIAVKEMVPITQCNFSRTKLDVRINDATLKDGILNGRAASPLHSLHWSLRYTGLEPPLLLLPESLYEGGFPKAKALVGTPNAEYTGALTVDGCEIPINGWTGSQNHNWGSRHTDNYAWGQVAGFDNAPDAFLECCTAQVKIGPIWSPRLTFVVLRDEEQETAINGLLQAVRAYGKFDFFSWKIDARIYGRIHAPATSFVGLTYQNPPGGQKTCLNTKLASAEITLERRGKPPRKFKTANRAAFEILTDKKDHGVAIVA
jgi:hypothetical protein